MLWATMRGATPDFARFYTPLLNRRPAGYQAELRAERAHGPARGGRHLHGPMHVRVPRRRDRREGEGRPGGEGSGSQAGRAIHRRPRRHAMTSRERPTPRIPTRARRPHTAIDVHSRTRTEGRRSHEGDSRPHAGRSRSDEARRDGRARAGRRAGRREGRGRRAQLHRRLLPHRRVQGAAAAHARASRRPAP